MWYIIQMNILMTRFTAKPPEKRRQGVVQPDILLKEPVPPPKKTMSSVVWFLDKHQTYSKNSKFRDTPAIVNLCLSIIIKYYKYKCTHDSNKKHSFMWRYKLSFIQMMSNLDPFLIFFGSSLIKLSSSCFLWNQAVPSIRLGTIFANPFPTVFPVPKKPEDTNLPELWRNGRFCPMGFDINPRFPELPGRMDSFHHGHHLVPGTEKGVKYACDDAISIFTYIAMV